MGERVISRGTCVFCKNSYAKSGMSRHLKACKARQEAIDAQKSGKARQTKLFHLQIQGTYNPWYWLHLEIPTSATLRDLDQFLRDIWLECCGHLSMFRIGEQNYIVEMFDDWWNDEDKDMNVELARVLTPGLEFAHEYDFGSTTYLTLKVVAEREGVADKRKPIQVLARNDPPDYRCEICDEPATWINVFEDYALLCDAHAEEYDEGLLPVVNSPRTGVCGYTG